MARQLRGVMNAFGKYASTESVLLGVRWPGVLQLRRL